MDVEGTGTIPLEPRPPGCQVPLVPWQLWIWKEMCKQQERLSVRMRAASFRIIGPLDESVLRSCTDLVVKRHESLRTRIVHSGDDSCQEIDVDFSGHFRVTDLTSVSPVEIEREAQSAVREFMAERIDLSVGPLFEGRLFRMAKCEHVLVLALDHMIGDAVSCGVLANEIWGLYCRSVQNSSMPLPELPLQFGDYAVWMNRMMAGWSRKCRQYWLAHVSGVTRVAFPLEDQPGDKEGASFAMRHATLGKFVTDKLRSMGRSEQLKLPFVVLAIFSVALARWCKQREFLIFLNYHGRDRPGLEGMIGLLSSGLIIRMKVGQGDSFRDIAHHARREFDSAHANQGAHLAATIAPACGAMDVVFNWNWMPTPAKNITDVAVKIKPFPIGSGPLRGSVNEYSPIQLLAAFSDTPSGIVMSLRSESGLHAPVALDQFARNICSLGSDCAERPLDIAWK